MVSLKWPRCCSENFSFLVFVSGDEDAVGRRAFFRRNQRHKQTTGRHEQERGFNHQLTAQRQCCSVNWSNIRLGQSRRLHFPEGKAIFFFSCVALQDGFYLIPTTRPKISGRIPQDPLLFTVSGVCRIFYVKKKRSVPQESPDAVPKRQLSHHQWEGRNFISLRVSWKFQIGVELFPLPWRSTKGRIQIRFAILVVAKESKTGGQTAFVERHWSRVVGRRGNKLWWVRTDSCDVGRLPRQGNHSANRGGPCCLQKLEGKFAFFEDVAFVFWRDLPLRSCVVCCSLCPNFSLSFVDGLLVKNTHLWEGTVC